MTDIQIEPPTQVEEGYSHQYLISINWVGRKSTPQRPLSQLSRSTPVFESVVG
jgi:hypothetical protein